MAPRSCVARVFGPKMGHGAWFGARESWRARLEPGAHAGGEDFHEELDSEMRTQTLAGLLVLTIGGALTFAGQGARQEVQAYLTGVGFTESDLARLEAGEVLARAEQGGSNDEVVVAGAVKIRARPDRVASYYGQMITYVDGEVTLAFGRFSSPPVLADVQGLSLDSSEVDALKSCRVGDCDLRLGGTGLGTLRSRVNWDAPGYVDEANRVARDAIVRYLTDYQARGDAALVTYDDRAEAVSLRQQWRGILANSTAFYQYLPELRDYLASYPSGRPPGARDVFYWVKEDYGLKPVISVVHAVIYEPPDRTDRVFIVQKQLYASHYYDGSLAVGTVLAATDGTAPVSYLLYGNRSRGDLLKGGFGGLRRTVARRQAQSAAVQTMGTIKRVLEESGR